MISLWFSALFIEYTETINNGVIHKVRTLGVGKGGPAKSVLARMGRGGGSAVSVRTP